MPGPEGRRKKQIPEWAERERVGDLSWIQDNAHVLWPAARQSYEEQGRGAIFIDTLTTFAHQEGLGNPMFYLNEAAIEKSEQHHDALRMVRAYDPDWELVSVLLKKGRESTYRVGVPHVKRSTVTS